ncbi:MAG: hypothetical protein ACI841_004896 [Planctomycetota bacterium]|jgi:hypothetical protein
MSPFEIVETERPSLSARHAIGAESVYPATSGLSNRQESAELAPVVDRVLGRHDQGRAGPLVIVLGGLHGNEPAGLAAAKHVSSLLESRIGEGGASLSGRLVFLSGNRAALARETRYIDTDLNRMWSAESIERVRSQDSCYDSSEERELRELLDVLEFELTEARGDAVLLDLHSTSAGGAPFAIIGDTLRNLRLTGVLPIPTLLGLEERIDGPLLSWFADKGHIAMVVEGGQNDADSTFDHHVASIWLTLVATGSMAREDVPEVWEAHARLSQVAHGLPKLIEVEEGHSLTLGDGFQMLPCFDNFQEVQVGQPLANDLSGVIRATMSGHILMPLYQGQGDDGFFLGREIAGSWLRFASWLRASRLESLLSHLPGLAPHPQTQGSLIQETPELRPIVQSFLRLFGYRKQRVRDGLTVLERRKQ